MVVAGVIGIVVVGSIVIASGVLSPRVVGETRVFHISALTAENGNFNVSTITVKQGDHIVLKVTSEDTSHGILLSTPWVTVNKIAPPGQETTVEFDAAERGTYTIYCANSLCSPLHHEMTITLVIE
jgi:heme/copper-type cytochrome/quinol oxidase subunit 2